MVQKARKLRSLNVKDPEAHRLARAIAQETGETLTHAVTEALRSSVPQTQEAVGSSYQSDPVMKWDGLGTK